MVAHSRRNFLRGGLAFLAAPAIVRASSLMPVKAFGEQRGFLFSGFYSAVPLGQLKLFGVPLYNDVYDHSGRVVGSIPAHFYAALE